MYTFLRATSLTLVSHLRNHFYADPILGPLFDPAQAGTMEITLNTPEEMGTANLQGLSVWLYRTTRDEQLLNQPPDRITAQLIRRPPLPMLLHYLFTPIISIAPPPNTSASPEREQIVLGKVLQVFHDTPLLRGTDLADALAGSPLELGIRLETLTLEEITRVWEGLARSYQLSLSYEVAPVPIYTERADVAASEVQIALPEFGVITASEVP